MRCSSACSALSSAAKSPATHHASSAPSNSPTRGPAGTPSAMTSAPPRGKRGGQHDAHEPVVLHGTDELRRARRHQQAQHLLAYPLRRQPRQSFTLGDAGGQTVPVGRACAILGRKTEETQDAQVVLADALTCLAGEAHAARLAVPV